MADEDGIQRLGISVKSTTPNGGQFEASFVLPLRVVEGRIVVVEAARSEPFPAMPVEKVKGVLQHAMVNPLASRFSLALVRAGLAEDESEVPSRMAILTPVSTPEDSAALSSVGENSLASQNHHPAQE